MLLLHLSHVLFYSTIFLFKIAQVVPSLTKIPYPQPPPMAVSSFINCLQKEEKKKNESFSTIMTTREHSNTFWWTKPFLDKTNNLENRIQCAILKSIKGSFILALLFCPAVVSFISKIFIYITGDVKFLMILLLHL